MNCALALVVALATVMVSVSGQGYEIDPRKLDERYNLILGIVGRGIPYRAHAAHKPKIGSAYAAHKPTIGSAYANPSAGYNTARVGYKAPTATYSTGYSNPGAAYNPYNQVRGYGYNPSGYPSANAGLGYNPSYGATAYKFGGGQVHPIFNNDLLYRPKVINNDLGSFGSKDPIFIGGGAPGAKPVGVPAVPQVDAYGNPRTGSAKSFTGKDAIGGTFTGQRGSLYQNLPGYTNPYFNKA